MAKVEVSIVHDELGRIVSIARPSKDAKVVILSGGPGQTVLVAEVDEDMVPGLVHDYRVDTNRRSLVRY